MKTTFGVLLQAFWIFKVSQNINFIENIIYNIIYVCIYIYLSGRFTAFFLSLSLSSEFTVYHMLIVQAVFSIPLLYMELFLGQYSRLNCLSLGKITPLAHGKKVLILCKVIYHH